MMATQFPGRRMDCETQMAEASLDELHRISSCPHSVHIGTQCHVLNQCISVHNQCISATEDGITSRPSRFRVISYGVSPRVCSIKTSLPPVSVVVASRTNQRTVSARRPRNASVPFVPACIVFAFELHHESSTPPAGRRHADRPTITSYSLVRINKKVLDNRSRDSMYCIFCRYINLEIRRTFGKRAPFPASLPGSNDKNSHV
jgi:hypothetical protein